MKWLAGVGLVAVLVATTDETIETVYEEGQELEVESRARSEMRLDSMELFVDDEPLPVDGDPPAGDTKADERVFAYSDVYEEVRDGKPTRIRRSFDEISRSQESEQESSEMRGVLEGRTILISVDEDEEVTAEIADDEGSVDDRFLEGFRIHFTEELLLPEGSVEEGESWSVEGDELNVLLGIDPGAEFFEEDEGSDFAEVLVEAASFEADATYEGRDEKGGTDCWLISYEISMDAEIDDFDPAMVGIDPEESGFGEGALAVEGSGTGRLWIGREEKRLFAHEFEGAFEIELSMSQSTEQFDLRMVLTMGIELEGEKTWTTP